MIVSIYNRGGGSSFEDHGGINLVDMASKRIAGINFPADYLVLAEGVPARTKSVSFPIGIVLTESSLCDRKQTHRHTTHYISRL